MTKELLKQALEALLSVKNHGWDEDTHTGRALITDLKAALEQPVQEQQQAEPVVWDKPSDNFNEWWDSDRRRDNANLFTTDSFAYWAWEGWQAALAQRQWVGLTNEEIRDCLGPEAVRIPPGWSMWTQAIEAALRSKNT